MATRSTIAVELPSGTIAKVYCHWDGYLEGVGRTLVDHYRGLNDAVALISLGSMSSLGKVIGEKHPFSAAEVSMPLDEHDEKYGHMTTYYGRDRGEDGTEYKCYANYKDYLDNVQFEEFNYILRQDGKWYVCKHDWDQFCPVEDELCNMRFIRTI